MLSRTEIFDRIYAGFIAKAIGVRLGAPVEPTIWSYERIRDTYGEVTQYLRDFKNFAADDDTNGPVYFIRALRDYGLDATAEDVGRTWLNYAAEEHGMYWWGGFGVSTEHTAYRNLTRRHPGAALGRDRDQRHDRRRADRRPDLHRQLGLGEPGQPAARRRHVGDGRERRARWRRPQRRALLRRRDRAGVRRQVDRRDRRRRRSRPSPATRPMRAVANAVIALPQGATRTTGAPAATC